MKNAVRRALNLGMCLAFCGLLGSGMLLAWRLPPGSRGGAGLTALGHGRHDWGDLHMWLACVMAALVAAHLAVNWAWLRKVAAGGRRWPLALGMATGAAVVGFFLLVPVQQRELRCHQQQGACHQ